MREVLRRPQVRQERLLSGRDAAVLPGRGKLLSGIGFVLLSRFVVGVLSGRIPHLLRCWFGRSLLLSRYPHLLRSRQSRRMLWSGGLLLRCGVEV
jgi:hypothetical protein